jgi:hypothetical protein
MEVKLKINQEWVPALNYQKEAFWKFKHEFWNQNNVSMINYLREGEININNNGYNFKICRERNNDHNGIYLIKENGEKVPITDFNSVKIFLVERGTWVDARWYQTRAYYDFIYDSEEIKEYDFGGGIIFSISRNENGSIYYEKDDHNRSRVKISDNPGYISAYQGFYNRITDVGELVNPTPMHNSHLGYLPLPLGLDTEETSNESDQCVICFKSKKNIKFIPCGHNHTCSLCYVQITKPRECPFCKQEIESIEHL